VVVCYCYGWFALVVCGCCLLLLLFAIVVVVVVIVRFSPVAVCRH